MGSQLKHFIADVDFRKLFSRVTLILAVVLLPPATAAWASQNAVPGDRIYPVKRSLEAAILTFYSYQSPYAKTSYQIALGDRRFKEATILLQQRDSAEGLSTLVADVREARRDLETVANDQKKEELRTDLSGKLKNYVRKLEDINKEERRTVPSGERVYVPIIFGPTPAGETSLEFPVAPSPTPFPTQSLLLPTSSPSPVFSTTPSPTPTVSKCPNEQDCSLFKFDSARAACELENEFLELNNCVIPDGGGGGPRSIGPPEPDESPTPEATATPVLVSPTDIVTTSLPPPNIVPSSTPQMMPPTATPMFVDSASPIASGPAVQGAQSFSVKFCLFFFLCF